MCSRGMLGAALGVCCWCTVNWVQAGTEYVFILDETQSTIWVELTVTLGGVDLTDEDASPVAGTVTALLTPPAGGFEQIHVTGMAIDLLQPVQFVLAVQFLGGVNVTGNEVGLRMGGGIGMPGPAVPVSLEGAFSQPDNQIGLVGTFTYNGFGLLGTPLGSGVEDLAEFGDFVANFGGTVWDDGVQVTLTAPITGTQSLDLDGYPVTVNVSGLLVGRAPSQAVTYCPGDLNCDTHVNFADISPFIAAIKAGGPGAWNGECPYLNGDFTGDGVVNFTDISPFIAALKAPPPPCVSGAP